MVLSSYGSEGWGMDVIGRPPIGDYEQDSSIEVALAPCAPGYAALVTLAGEHDIESCPALRDALEPLFGTVLVDLTQCRFMDSSVIAALIRKFRELEREGCRLELVVPPDNDTLSRTLEIVSMRSLMTVHPRIPAVPEPLLDASSSAS